MELSMEINWQEHCLVNKEITLSTGNALLILLGSKTSKNFQEERNKLTFVS
jgi:hypothetical protein